MEYGGIKEAYLAYSSPKAPFGNRFVRVGWWYRDPTTSNEEDLSNYSSTSGLMMMTTTEMTTPEEISRRDEERRMKTAEAERLRRELEEQMSLLLKRQEEHRLALLSKIQQSSASTSTSNTNNIPGDNGGILDQDRDEILSALNAVTNVLAKAQESRAAPIRLSSTSESMQDSSAVVYARGRGRGIRGIRGARGSRGSIRGRGRGSFSTNTYSLDLRPRQLLLTNISESLKPFIRAQLEGYGRIENFIWRSGTEVLVKFWKRAGAEGAFNAFHALGSGDQNQQGGNGGVEAQWNAEEMPPAFLTSPSGQEEDDDAGLSMDIE